MVPFLVNQEPREFNPTSSEMSGEKRFRPLHSPVAGCGLLRFMGPSASDDPISQKRGRRTARGCGTEFPSRDSLDAACGTASKSLLSSVNVTARKLFAEHVPTKPKERSQGASLPGSTVLRRSKCCHRHRCGTAEEEKIGSRHFSKTAENTRGSGR
jgi:hypothetical protein